MRDPDFPGERHHVSAERVRHTRLAVLRRARQEWFWRHAKKWRAAEHRAEARQVHALPRTNYPALRAAAETAWPGVWSPTPVAALTLHDL